MNFRLSLFVRSLPRRSAFFILATFSLAAQLPALVTPPTITPVGPLAIEAAAEGPVTMTTTITGDPVPLLQWYQGEPGDETKPVAGGTSATLTVTANATGAVYWLKATNLAGAVQSPAFRYTSWRHLPSAPFLAGVRQFGSTIVGVGYDDVHVSTDGRRWMKRGTAANSNLKDLAQGGGVYVALGERGIFTSPDLEQWTKRNDVGGASIAWGNGVFVIAGITRVSTDGVIWTAATLPAEVVLKAVIFDGTQFVAVGSVGGSYGAPGVILRSADGSTWSELTRVAGAPLSAISFVGGKYLATSSEVNRVLVSANLANWSRHDLGFGSGCRSAAYAFGRYLIGTDSGLYFTSTDAASWTATVGAADMSSTILHPFNGAVLAAGPGGIHLSSDAWTWSRVGAPPGALSGITHALGRYFATSARTTYNQPGLYTSPDGVDWEWVSGLVPTPVVAALGRLFSISNVNGELLSSDDGERWTRHLKYGASFSRVVSAGSRLFAFAADRFITSTDGSEWTIGAGSIGTGVMKVAYGNGVYVGVGTLLARSTDGLTWTSQSPPFATILNDVAFGHGMFVAVGTKSGSRACVMTSSDGQTWVERSLPDSVVTDLSSVAFASDAFFTATSQGLVYSPDGITWWTGQGVIGGAVSRANGRVLATDGVSLWMRALDGRSTSIVENPLTGYVAPGTATPLTVKAAGSNLTYQWYQGSSGSTANPVAAATSNSFTTPALTSSQSYWVRVSGPGGSADSATARVLVASQPVIDRQPASIDLFADNPLLTVHLQVRCPPSGGLSYQWYTGRSGDTLHPITGARGRSLFLAWPEQTTRYWVRITDARGVVDSAEAVVTRWDRTVFDVNGVGNLGTLGFAWSAGNYIVAGLRHLPSPSVWMMLTSTDGVTWSERPGYVFGTLVAGANGFLATGAYGEPKVHLSEFLNTWTEVSPPGVAAIVDAYYAGGRYFALSTEGTFAVSANATSWTPVTLPTTRVYAVAFGSGKWIASGAGGALFQSVDALNWSPIPSFTAATIRCLAYGRDRFLLLTDEGEVFASSDGSAWVRQPVESTTGWLTLPESRRLNYVNGRFFAAPALPISQGMASVDGLLWWPTAPLDSVAFDAGSHFGTNRTVKSSAVGQISVSGGGAFYRSRPAADTPVVTTHPLAQSIVAGQPVSLSVAAASSTALSYQWRKDGVDVPGATLGTFTLANPQPADSGSYAAVITNAAGSVLSRPAVLTVTSPIPRGLVAGMAQTTTAGGAVWGAFTIEGTAPKRMLVRGVGPTLAAFGTTSVAADPELFITAAATNTVVASNDNWGSAPNAPEILAATAEVGAYPFATDSRDAAVLATFAPGTYRVAVAPRGVPGVVGLEIYDAGSSPRLVHLSTRGWVGRSGAFVLAITLHAPPSGRSYLVRALGPALGGTDSLADPRLRVSHGLSLLASNDNWGGSEVLAQLAGRAGAMPLDPAGKDSAIHFVPPAPGSYAIEVTGPEAAEGMVLVEVFEVDSDRAAALPLAFVALPQDQVVDAGQPAAFGAVAVGRPAPQFQWRKGAAEIPGATGPGLAWSRAQVSDAGTYVLHVSDGAGASISASVTLTVNPVNNAAHAMVGRGYVPGGTVTIATTLHYVGAPASLGWSVGIPSGWTFAADDGSAANVKPAPNASGLLEWRWTSPPASPVTFSYTLNVPPGEAEPRELTAAGQVGDAAVVPVPYPLPVRPAPPFHSADTNRDDRIDLVELTRVIQLYNTRNGTVRTGCYAVATGTSEDGFVADPIRGLGAAMPLARHHSADTNRDGQLDLRELTRVIELYSHRIGPTRTGQYHARPGTEDGFAPGP